MNAFTANQFTATEFDTAEDKAKWANHVVRFIKSGFNPSLFHQKFYERLSMTFGHIAHYDRGGFYVTWFANDEKRLQWLQYVARGGAYYGACGDAAFTYCDVERVLMAWVQENGFIELYAKRVAEAVEHAERAELVRLKSKYEGAHGATQASA